MLLPIIKGTKIDPYFRLMRADKPIGTWLLLLPCWQSLMLSVAFTGWKLELVWLLFAFGIGAFVMRGAGCAYNDWVDRDIDRQITRTRNRPIASGEISRKQGAVFIAGLCFIGFLILISLNTQAILLGMASLVFVGIYPWAKRFTWWPQLFLGLAFNWGALMGWVAYTGDFSWRIIALYLAGILWTLGYDTIYAHQDREDDALVGVKSSALRLGEQTKSALLLFYGGAVILTAVAGYGLNWPFWLGLMTYAGSLFWQIYQLDIHNPDRCLQLFRFNRITGFALLFGITGSALIV